ncbi:MAG TPA: hypothetical protein VJU86_01335 [Pyrinomonadaceae bacterium]|nr:hypothetical protein [Pyrinomonadaceae bacterium]
MTLRKPSILSIAILFVLGATDAVAQKSKLIGTTWILRYTTGKANSPDYEEYARVTFQKGGKVLFDNGETGRWNLKGSRLTIQNDKQAATGLVNYVEATIKGKTGTGSAELGMKSVRYWVRLIKQE